MKECERFRRNDYVGPPIWGFKVPPGTKVGDQLYYDDGGLPKAGRPSHRSFYEVAEIDGRLACIWAPNERSHPRWIADKHARFAGFIG